MSQNAQNTAYSLPSFTTQKKEVRKEKKIPKGISASSLKSFLGEKYDSFVKEYKKQKNIKHVILKGNRKNDFECEITPHEIEILRRYVTDIDTTLEEMAQELGLRNASTLNHLANRVATILIAQRKDLQDIIFSS